MTVAIEAMGRLPDLYRPEQNIVELKAMLDDMSPEGLSLTQFQARRYIDILQGIEPDAQRGMSAVVNHHSKR
jgi:hypothetical protein